MRGLSVTDDLNVSTGFGFQSNGYYTGEYLTARLANVCCAFLLIRLGMCFFLILNYLKYHSLSSWSVSGFYNYLFYVLGKFFTPSSVKPGLKRLQTAPGLRWTHITQLVFFNDVFEVVQLGKYI